jgi:hypothetical protein
MEEVMAERRRKKLACFQKTQSGVVKKGDTAMVSSPVNSPFTLEELVDMIHVSVSSKYRADLEVIAQTSTDSMRGSIESLRLEFKQDSENLPGQVRAMVQQVLGEVRDKREFESPGASTAAPNLGMTITQGIPANTDGLGSPGVVANHNLQQPFYQTHAYSPSSQAVPDAYFPRPPIIPIATWGAYGGMSKNVRDHVARALRVFGLEPKGQVRTYQKPCPEFFDKVPDPSSWEKTQKQPTSM